VVRHQEETPEGIQAEIPEGIPELEEERRQEDKPLMD
jgi:hypothetical protein